MTNKYLVTHWKKLGIKLKKHRTVKKMADIFMICWGESEMDMPENKKEKVVVFDVGGAMGNPALFCTSDKEDNCWEYGYDPKKKCTVKRVIGKFVKV